MLADETSFKDLQQDSYLRSYLLLVMPISQITVRTGESPLIVGPDVRCVPRLDRNKTRRHLANLLWFS
jgi:hypothetical protein